MFVVPPSWTSVLKILVTQNITKFPREERLNWWGYEPCPKGSVCPEHSMASYYGKKKRGKENMEAFTEV